MIKLEAPRRPKGEIVVGWAPAYAKSGSGQLTHRVRSGVTIVRQGKISHVALTAWCSQCVFVDSTAKSARLSDSLPTGEQLCAVCELKAVKRGQPPTTHANHTD